MTVEAMHETSLGWKEREMEQQETSMEKVSPARRKRILASAGLLATGVVAGGILGITHVAGAATATQTPAASAPANMPDPATVAHGPGETLLTGTNLDKATAAAKAAVPGATIIRVETDSAGSPYEAHMKKSDGSYVTVKIDKNFKVTAIQDGFGGRPRGTPPSASQTSA
jgi:hypothetical protein